MPEGNRRKFMARYRWSKLRSHVLGQGARKQVGRIAKRAVKTLIEKKSKDVAVGPNAIVYSTPVFHLLNPIGQGDGDTTHDGNV